MSEELFCISPLTGQTSSTECQYAEAITELRERIKALEAENSQLRQGLDLYRGQVDRYGKNSASDSIDAARAAGYNGEGE